MAPLPQPVEPFTGEDGQHYARVVDPENGKELTRTSEGYEHAEDAIHAIEKSTALVIGAHKVRSGSDLDAPA